MKTYVIQTDDETLYRHCAESSQQENAALELVIGGVGRTVSVVSIKVTYSWGNTPVLYPYEIGLVTR